MSTHAAENQDEFQDRAATLGAGESLLWQGRPQFSVFVLRAFHAKIVAAYFGLLTIWRLAANVANGDPMVGAIVSAAWMLVPAAGAVGVLMVLAWLFSRTTRYMITSRRIVMQFGVALPITLNIPFRFIASAAVKLYPDGTGDIPVVTSGRDRIAYLVLWPHARPWRLAQAEPMLRAVPDAKRVADILARALAAVDARSPLEATGSSAEGGTMPHAAATAAA